MQRNEKVILTQRARLKEVIGKLVLSESPYALVDFPDHSNVGDSAIWLGEIKLLLQLTGNMPAYVSTVETFDATKLEKAVPNGPILIHGGGSFGDIWRKHQDFREAILKRFKDRLVVQLPQSIKFHAESSIKQCAAIIGGHPNFHLLVRDQPSLELAQRSFPCTTHLVPDAAFALGSLNRPIKPLHELFMLLRTDAESATYDREPFNIANAVSDDWLEEPVGFHQLSKLQATLLAVVKGAWTQEQWHLIYYQLLATGRLNRGLRMLSSGERVITDRLHAHILSTLLDIPHVALDNNYGKVSGYMNAWTRGYAGVEMANTADEALAKIKLLPA
jgi:exopolysaccharide biosynthesis predicted pyruvyltransferase EpsI